MWALYAREVHRFKKLWMDTVFSPIVSVVLYLSVFGIVVGTKMIGDLSYIQFVYTGLLSMMMVNSSFSNPAFALIISKSVGTMVDLQLAPIKPWKIGMAYALAALTRGVVTVLVAVLATIWFIPSFGLHNSAYLLLGFGLTGLEFGMLGLIFGMKAKNFEALTFMTTFIMQPMIFLAGVFYPIAALPGIWSKIAVFNPIHHNVNIMRYGATGYADGSPLLSLIVVCVLIAVLFVLMHVVTKKSIRA